MKRIKRVGRIQPRGTVEFYRENPDLYKKLKAGETIEVPDDVFPLLTHVKETTEVIEEILDTYSKPKKKKSKNRTYPQSYVEANLSDEARKELYGEEAMVERHEDSIIINQKAGEDPEDIKSDP